MIEQGGSDRHPPPGGPVRRPLTGRLRPGENQAPPLGFGLPFAAAGLFMLAIGVGQAIVVLIPFGLFFAVIGIGLILTSVRAESARVPVHVAGGGPGVDVFTRSPMRVLVDLVLAPIGGVGFLAFAFVFADPLISLVYTRAYLDAVPVLRLYIVGLVAFVVELTSILFVLHQGPFAARVARPLGSVPDAYYQGTPPADRRDNPPTRGETRSNRVHQQRDGSQPDRLQPRCSIVRPRALAP